VALHQDAPHVGGQRRTVRSGGGGSAGGWEGSEGL